MDEIIYILWLFFFYLKMMKFLLPGQGFRLDFCLLMGENKEKVANCGD